MCFWFFGVVGFSYVVGGGVRGEGEVIFRFCELELRVCEFRLGVGLG